MSNSMRLSWRNNRLKSVWRYNTQPNNTTGINKTDSSSQTSSLRATSSNSTNTTTNNKNNNINAFSNRTGRQSIAEYVEANRASISERLTAQGANAFKGAVRLASENATFGIPSRQSQAEALRNTISRNSGATLHEMAVKGMLPRTWTDGDVYAPKDLGRGEAIKWNTRKFAPDPDPFEKMGRNPLEFYKNFTVLSQYMTSTAQILPRSKTGLTVKNHKLMSKAIRRAIGIGLIPSTYHHPMIALPMDRQQIIPSGNRVS